MIKIYLSIKVRLIYMHNRSSSFLNVVLIMGHKGAYRRKELRNTLIDGVEYKTDVIFVAKLKTKNYVPRQFTITEKLGIDLIKRYINLIPSKISQILSSEPIIFASNKTVKHNFVSTKNVPTIIVITKDTCTVIVKLYNHSTIKNDT